MTFDPIGSPVNFATLAGQRTPGVAEIVGAAAPRKWDVVKSHGSSGARSIFRGRDIAKFTLRLTLFTAAHFTEWAAFRPLVMALPRGQAGHMEISHPVLDELGISSVGVEEVGQLTRGGTGEWTVDIKLIEHRPLQRALSSPDGSDTTAAPVDQDDVDLRQAEAEAQYEGGRYP